MSNGSMPITALQNEYGTILSTPEGEPYYSLTKREYFAGLAMQSIIAAKHEEIKWWADECKQQSFAKSAVAYADALITELEKEDD